MKLYEHIGKYRKNIRRYKNIIGNYRKLFVWPLDYSPSRVYYYFPLGRLPGYPPVARQRRPKKPQYHSKYKNNKLSKYKQYIKNIKHVRFSKYKKYIKKNIKKI